MQHQPRRDTAPERALRSELHRRGFRYRVDTYPLPGLRRRADILFRPQKVAVFVDGCFWHGCPEHGHLPAKNTWYWPAKIRRNAERDQDTDQRLREAGWRPIRVWEHEDPVVAAARIARELNGDCEDFEGLQP